MGLISKSSLIALSLLLLSTPWTVWGQEDPGFDAGGESLAGRGDEQGEDIENCPSRCLCFKSTVRCMFINLDSVPKKLPKSTSVLDLRFNRIRNLQPGIFENVPELHTLLLNNNQLQELRSGVFSGISNLKYLYLYKNDISHIDRDVFNGMDQLEQLYLHFNDLTTLEPGTFASLPALDRLFLHNNRIQRLPQDLLTGTTAIMRLRLDSNPLICDCSMSWLSARLSEGHMQATLTCESPHELSGQSLTSLKDVLRCQEPRIIEGPSDVEFGSGETIQLRCRAEGDPQPQIIWYRNSDQYRPTDRVRVLDDGSLMIQNAGLVDQGTYECRANNGRGEASSVRARVRHNGGENGRETNPATTYGVPRVVLVPEDQTHGEGETATFDCQSLSLPRARISWFHNNNPVPLLDPRVRGDPENGRLVISDLKQHDRGVYRCTAINNLGSGFAAGRLEVHLAPEFSRRPRDQRVVEGQAVFFSCDVGGDPPLPKITWAKDGRSIQDDGHIGINPSGTTLTIGSVRPNDGGVYECIATNNGGRRSASATLHIISRRAPTILSGPSDLRMPPGAEAKFDCDARGEPEPAVRWMKDHNLTPLTTSNKYHVNTQNSLIIHNIDRSDSGTYTCLAENVAGRVTSSASLSISDVRFDSLSNQHLSETVRRVSDRVTNAIENSERDFRQIRDPNHRRTPAELLLLARSIPSSARSFSQAAEVFEQTLQVLYDEIKSGNSYNLSYSDPAVAYKDLLTTTQLSTVARLSGCTQHQPVPNCEDMCFHLKYRTIDGTCNSLRKPRQGSGLSTLLRLLPPRYENGFNSPVGWDRNQLYNGARLPSPRTVSTHVISTRHVTSDSLYTHMLMQWGQFLDHDLSFVPTAVSHARFSDGRFCNDTCDQDSAPCFPIHVEDNDPRVRRQRCIGFVRSSAMCGSGVTSLLYDHVMQREQLNLLTAYIDASQVYGSAVDEARALRDFSSNRGLLRGGPLGTTGKQLLPPNQGEFIDCQVDRSRAHVPCFQAGDHRVNEQLGLLVMHTIWFREHNRLATELLNHNPEWDGDTVYHEARKIVGAMMQRISYDHWLPKILGPRGMERVGPYKGYDPNVDARVSNEFAAAAFRFGHSLINPVLSRLNASFLPIPEGNLHLHQAFHAPYRLVEEGGIDPLLRGLFGVAAKLFRPSQQMNSELTEKLFTLAHDVALDLAAFNLQRGRDHAIQPYNSYRELCGLRRARSFDDFRTEIRDSNVLRRLQEVYKHPDNVELFVGGLAEEPMEGARVGPTFGCIIADQFKRARDGDRHWYENPGIFTSAQLTELRQASLARVICDNSDAITEIQSDVFALTEIPGGLLHCEGEDIPRIDLSVWSHCCQDCARSGDFRSITNHFRSRRSADQSYSVDKTEFKSAAQFENSTKSASAKVIRRKRVRRDLDAEEEAHIQEMVDHVSHMSHKMMDAVEVRLEGMEEIMTQLQSTIHKLNKKIQKMAKKEGSKPGKEDSGQGAGLSTCLDHKGGVKLNGDEWKESECLKCSCKKGEIECMEESCKKTDCLSPRKIAGECCPRCT